MPDERDLLGGLRDVVRAMCTAVTEADVLAAASRGVVALVPSATGMIARSESDGGTFRITPLTAHGDEPEVGTVVDATASAVGVVLDGATADVIAIDAGDHRPDVQTLAAIGLGEAFVAPLRIGRTTSAALIVANRAAGGFGETGVAALETLADSLGGALTRARAQASLADQLVHQASHDPLTGLLNRRALDARLTVAVERANAGEFDGCLLMIDVDLFKLVNDTTGHQGGDAILRELAARLKGRIAAHDTLARVGGDEFAVLLAGCSLAEGAKVAERLARSIESNEFWWDGRRFTITASIGVAGVAADAGSPQQLLADVDAAVYAAKDQGRNRIVLASSDDEAIVRRRGETLRINEIRQALADERLTLVAQPVLPIASASDRMHFEVFVRMLDEAGEMVEPWRFLSTSARFGVIRQVDLWVVRDALRQLKASPMASEVATCSINLSLPSFESDEVVSTISTLIAESGIDGRLLCFELSEPDALARVERVVRVIDFLHSTHGVRFCIDNFGSGSASFSYLRHVPVHLIKIHGNLIGEITVDPLDASVVRLINEVATSTGKEVVAERVEGEATVDMLRQLGVAFAQGYHLADVQPLGRLLRVDAGARAA